MVELSCSCRGLKRKQLLSKLVPRLHFQFVAHHAVGNGSGPSTSVCCNVFHLLRWYKNWLIHYIGVSENSENEDTPLQADSSMLFCNLSREGDD